MRTIKGLAFQLRHNYYVKFVTVFFSIITLSLLLLLFVFSRHQQQINNRELHDFNTNSFSRFTQILENKILADVHEVMSKGVTDIRPFHVLSDANPENPFLAANNPFNTTLSYMKRLNQLQQYYPYIASIDIYSFKYDTFITSYGSAYYNAIDRRRDLEALVPFPIIDAIRNSPSDQLWLSPAFNRQFARYADLTTFAQKMPLFGPDQDVELTILINIRPATLLADYFQGQMPENTFFGIVDAQGDAILQTSTDERFTGLMADPSILDRIEGSASGVELHAAGKDTYEVLWQNSTYNNWKYLYFSKRPSELAQLFLSLRYVITWFLIIFTACLLVTLVVSKKIYKPIALLTRYAKSVMKNPGDTAHDDIGELSDAFSFLYGQWSSYKDTISNSAPLLLHNIAMNLLDSDIHNVEELNSWLSILHVRFEHPSFFLLVFKIDAETYDNLDNRERDVMLLYIKEHVESYFSSRDEGTLRCISCSRPNGIIPFIINCSEEQYPQEKAAAAVILSNLNDDIAAHASIAVSDRITDLTEFNRAFRQTLDYFKYVFV